MQLLKLPNESTAADWWPYAWMHPCPSAVPLYMYMWPWVCVAVNSEEIKQNLFCRIMKEILCSACLRPFTFLCYKDKYGEAGSPATL